MRPLTHLPRGLISRAAASTRIAGALGAAALRQAGRSVAGGPDDDGGAALGEALVGELDQLKGLAMKVGQILSSLDAGLPEGTVAALARLQRGSRGLAPEAIEAVIEANLGAPPGLLFERFDRAPVAAASIGQVHRARLGARVGGPGGRPGAEVAVKVRYPGVADTIAADLAQLGGLARVASLATAVDGPALVAELRARIAEECDYRREAAWTAAVAGQLGAARAPRVFPERCGEAVLTTEWIDGRALLEAGPEAAGAAEALLALPWRTLFGRGFLHADPHPGNTLVDNSGLLVVLDWGCVRRAGPAEIEPVRRLLRVVLDGDRARFPAALAEAGLIGDAAHFDLDAGWALYRWLLAPYLVPRFTFDRAWAFEGRAHTGPRAPNQRAAAVPPLWIWLLRVLVAHHGQLGRIGLSLPARALLRDALDQPLQPLADPTAAG